MLLPCLLIILALVTVGKNLPTVVFWPILIGLCVLSHVFMMRRSGSHAPKEQETAVKDEHGVDASSHDHSKGGGCCH